MSVQGCIKLLSQSKDGFEPTRIPKMQRMDPELVKLYERKYANSRFGLDIPEWYPRDSRGHAITHVYHIVDNRSGTDMEYPCDADQALRQPRGTCDFAQKALIKASLLHIDEKCRHDDEKKSPLLSASFNFEQCVQFLLRPENGWSNSMVVPWRIARIDLWALVLDGVINERNFVRLDTMENFKQHFLRGPHSDSLRDYAADNKVAIGNCMSTSVHLGEVLIGARGYWWVPYSFLVDDGDRLLANQKSDYNNTEFGRRLLDIYTSIPHHPKHQAPQQAQSQPFNLKRRPCTPPRRPSGRSKPIKPRQPCTPPPSWLCQPRDVEESGQAPAKKPRQTATADGTPDGSAPTGGYPHAANLHCDEPRQMTTQGERNIRDGSAPNGGYSHAANMPSDGPRTGALGGMPYGETEARFLLHVSPIAADYVKPMDGNVGPSPPAPS